MSDWQDSPTMEAAALEGISENLAYPLADRLKAAQQARWGDVLAGLKPATLTLDNLSGHFEPFGGLFVEQPADGVPVRVSMPSTATWRDRARLRLHRIHLWRWYPFSWIALRWVDYHFQAEVWQTEDGIAGRAVGPITRRLEER